MLLSLMVGVKDATSDGDSIQTNATVTFTAASCFINRNSPIAPQYHPCSYPELHLGNHHHPQHVISLILATLSSRSLLHLRSVLILVKV